MRSSRTLLASTLRNALTAVELGETFLDLPIQPLSPLLNRRGPPGFRWSAVVAGLSHLT